MLQPSSASHDLSWDIASDLSGQMTPNVLSELKYRQMKSLGAGLGLDLAYRLKSHSPWSLSVGANYQDAALDNGDYTDSDYNDDNRSGLFSRSVGKVADGSYQQFSGQLGLHRDHRSGKHRLGILLGLERSELDTVMTNGVQTFSDSGVPLPTLTAELVGLHSRFDSTWESASVGFEYRYKQPSFGELFLRYSYHQGIYDAVADWNLRPDFQHPVSFIHQADSHGDALRVGYRSANTGAFGWRLEYEWREFETDPGFDRTFLSDGSITVTRLNQAKWDSQSLMLGLEWRL